jgi:RNA polymerase sigma-70 factor (ECF subfamily)
MALTRDKETAKELASCTIATAYERFETLRNPDAFVSFLFSIASRTHQKNYRKSKIFSFLDSSEDRWEAQSTNPEDSTDVRILYELLDKLPAKQKEAVILFEINEFSLEEIQSIQGGSLSGVKSRLKRGRESLKKLADMNLAPSYQQVSEGQSYRPAIFKMNLAKDQKVNHAKR